MRILEVTELDYIDKPVFEFQEFPEALAQRGHDVAVMDYDIRSDFSDVRKWGLGPKDVTVPGRLDPGRSVRLLRQIGPPGRALRRVWAAFWAPVVVRRVFDEVQPDVVLLYSVPTSGWAVVREATRRNIPVVFRSFDILSQLVPRFIQGPVHLLERWTYARCDRVLVSSPLVGAYVDRLSGGNTDTELLRLSVDTSRFAPGDDDANIRARYGIPADARVAVFVGTLFAFIGLMRLFDQWDQMRASNPRLHLLIVGGGPQEEPLRRRAAKLAEPNSVTMTGMMPYDQVPDFIRAADVGVCPFEVLPVTQDINPVKVVGYLACGLPTVCSTLDGTMAVLPHKESGVLYAEPGDAYAQTLMTLLGDDEECARLGAAGRAWAVDHHSIDALVSQLEGDLESAIEHVLARRGGVRTDGT